MFSKYRCKGASKTFQMKYYSTLRPHSILRGWNPPLGGSSFKPQIYINRYLPKQNYLRCFGTIFSITMAIKIINIIYNKVDFFSKLRKEQDINWTNNNVKVKWTASLYWVENSNYLSMVDWLVRANILICFPKRRWNTKLNMSISSQVEIKIIPYWILAWHDFIVKSYNVPVNPFLEPFINIWRF